MLRTILGSFRIGRLGLSAAVGIVVWSAAESEGWASALKEYPACASNADDANVQAARGAFEAGRAAFNEADYPRAILYWEDAFRRDCSATLMLKNLARAYEASGQYAEAVVALKTYLARAYEAEDRAELEDQLRALEAKIQPKTPAAAAPVPTSQPRSGMATNRPARADSAGEVSPNGSEQSQFDTAPEDKPLNSPRLAAGLVAGAGLALGAASTLFWLDADADEEAALNMCPTRRDCPEEVTSAGNDAIDRKQLWTIVGIGGGAVLVGGVIWYLVVAHDDESLDEAAAKAPQLMPAVTSDFAGLSWTNRF